MENNVLVKLLSHSKTTKTAIGIRKYNDGDDLYVGYIVDYTDSIIVLQHISKYGLEDGLIVEKIENIESFETEDEYLKTYNYFYNNPSILKKQTIKKIELSKEDNWQYEMFKSKFDKGKIVTVELNNSGIDTHGFIVDFDEIYLNFKPITNLGVDEGEIIFKLSDISGVSVDRLESRKREALYHSKKNV
ncbi:MAG: hypothetical protein PHT07_07315 [Paludibacter sp.]|nr:hypothetical protein [Paludibacter sp.]